MNLNKQHILIKNLLFAVCMLIYVSTFAQANNNGRICGRIIEQATKQPLTGANIILPGTDRGSTTDVDGNFFIGNIEEGIYKIEIHFIGYINYIKPDIRVVRGKTTYIEEIGLSQDIIEFKAVTISAGAFEEDKDVPVSSFKYTRQEIRRNPGAAGDIFRAIESFPGVSTSGGKFSAFSVRGAGPQDNIILVDNIPFPRVTHLEGGREDENPGGRFSIFAPGLIESAKFHAGGFPAQYGGKRASLLKLDIKEGNRFTPTLQGYVDLLGWEANYNGPSYLLNNTGFNISVRQQDLKNVLALVGQEDQGHPSFWDIIFKSTTEISPSQKISLIGIYSPEKFTRTLDNIYKSKGYNDNQMIDLEDTKILTGLNWRCLTGDRGFLQTTLYHSRFSRETILGKADIRIKDSQVPAQDDISYRDNILNERQKHYFYGIKTEYYYSFNSFLSCLAGSEWQYAFFNYRLRQSKSDTTYIFDGNDFRMDAQQKYLVTYPELVNSEKDSRWYNLSSYIQFTFKPINTLSITQGLRYMYFEYNNHHYIAPRISIKYDINSKTALSTAAGIYYQPPDERTIATNSPKNELKNEESVHFIAGLKRYLTDDLKLTCEVYYKELNNLLVHPNRVSLTYSNDGYGWASGIDVSLIKRFVSHFYGQVNYSYCRSEHNDNDGNGYYPTDFNRTHYFTFLAGYEFNKEWNFSAKWRYASGYPTDAYNIHTDVFNNPEYLRYSKEITDKNALRLPDQHNLNIRIDYRRQFNYFALVTYLDILNVYGHLNVVEERFLERTGKHEEKGFEMMPTFGLRVEL
ncbi:MAG: TonB-dependent receptor [Candidatus Marinimicrobia bacterium]|nr:TonB-dependent receptor [Candidatus Neomarinimicrobiota bacterium]